MTPEPAQLVVADDLEARVLTDPSEVLNRQVHPTMLDPQTGVSKGVFLPSANDRGMLSTLRGRVSPEEAHRRHVARSLASSGTWGVSVGEAVDAEVQVVDDEHLPENPADHASIDFTPYPEKPPAQRRRVANELRNAANARGPLFRP